MKRALLFLALGCSQVFATDDPGIVVPPLSKPTAVPVEGDPLQATYDAAWTKYDQAITTVTEELIKALDGRFEKAADAGDLELAEFWTTLKKGFVDTRSLSWPTDGKTKAEWRKKFPGVEFPEEISAAVKTANQGFLEAGATLKSDYDGLVKEYTKARNLERARQLREEMASLDKKPDAPRQRPRMVEGKPAPAKPVAKPLLDRIAGKWSTPEEALVRVIHADGRCFEIRKKDGGVHSKGKVTVRQDGVGVVQLDNGFKLEFRPLKPDDEMLELQVFGPGAVKPFAVVSLHRMP